MSEPLQPFDWHRIFLGELPWSFTLEIALRTGFIYLYTLLLLRFSGRRGMSQLSAFDYLIIIAMGSAVGDPMLYPEVPLLHALVVVSIIVLLQRALVRLTERNLKMEKVLEGQANCLIREGQIDLRRMHHEGLSHNELFEGLRAAGIAHLGQVRRAYIEPSGQISVLKFSPEQARPGLSVWPDLDLPRLETGEAGEGGEYACTRCGYSQTIEARHAMPQCPRCQHPSWQEALA